MHKKQKLLLTVIDDVTTISSYFSSLLPIVGQYEISDVAKMTVDLHRQYGKIVRFGGLIGRPDLLFVNDADEIEKVRPRPRNRNLQSGDHMATSHNRNFKSIEEESDPDSVIGQKFVSP